MNFFDYIIEQKIGDLLHHMEHDRMWTMEEMLVTLCEAKKELEDRGYCDREHCNSCIDDLPEPIPPPTPDEKDQKIRELEKDLSNTHRANEKIYAELERTKKKVEITMEEFGRAVEELEQVKRDKRRMRPEWNFG
jgi:peptidoglycan hydrolase CwlO-like protein